jgi:hypothetical protein
MRATPYRDPDSPPVCSHGDVEKRVLKGGDGPDDAAEQWTCRECDAYCWKYCDGTMSQWRS